MGGLEIHEVGNLPEFTNGHLFNSPGFQQLMPANKKYYILTKSERPVARVSFSLGNGIAFSGQNATFGSFDFEELLAVDEIKYFVGHVTCLLKQEGIQKIILKHWPAAYELNSKTSLVFEEMGFKVLSSEVNQHILVQDVDFNQIVKHNEQKKLRQALDRDYKFRLLNTKKLTDVYLLVKETRDRKGYPVSMSFDELARTVKALPGKFLLFGVFDNENLIAASVSINISRAILYNFYHADDINYRSTSPIVLLLQGIYQYCQQKHIDILDLGVSSVEGKINDGLYNFKKNLGSVSSEKNTYLLNYE